MMKTLITIAFIFTVSLVSFAQAPCKANAGQRASFAELTPAEKVVLWKDHLQTELRTRQLNGEQRRLVQFGIDTVSVEFYEAAAQGNFPQTPLGRSMERFRQDLRANFSLIVGSEIFEQLPNYQPEELNLLPSNCDCSTTWTFCGSEGSCSTDCWAGCSNCVKVINCGPFWGFQCNGKCSVVLERK